MKNEKKKEPEEIKKDVKKPIKHKTIPQADIEMLREDQYESRMNGEDDFDR